MRPGRLPRSARAAAALAVVGAVAWSLASLDLGTGELTPAWTNLRLFLDRALPVDASVLPQASIAMVETVQMAVLGTVGAALLAVPLAVLGSRNLFPGPVGMASRTLLAALRTLPAILWALILVAIVGVGVLAGVLALALYTIGYLGKLQYEAIEGLSREAIEALEGMGASRLQVIRHVVLPETGNALLSHTLFAFDYNVRHASVLGVVGAGGIGTLMLGYLNFFQLDRLLTVLLIVFATVLLIDGASRAVRSGFTDPPMSGPAATPP